MNMIVRMCCVVALAVGAISLTGCEKKEQKPTAKVSGLEKAVAATADAAKKTADAARKTAEEAKKAATVPKAK